MKIMEKRIKNQAVFSNFKSFTNKISNNRPCFEINGIKPKYNSILSIFLLSPSVFLWPYLHLLKVATTTKYEIARQH